jgi:predicted helicase
MSVQLVQQYYAKVEKLIQYSGTRNESTLRKAFQDLLEQYAHSKNLLLAPEVEYVTKKGNKVYPDGTLKDALRQDWGYWESKDEKDNLEQEITSKFAKGYPDFNILFEDTHTAILFQNGEEISRADFADAQSLDSLLIRFVSYESPQVREFHKAIEQFSADVPKLAETLRKIIEEQTETNNLFREKSKALLEHFKKAINPNIQIADIREMIIQHILTEDIFMRIFDDAEFHRENNIAVKLSEISNTFYTGATKRNIDSRISYYYETINAKASQISDHHEKQKFLKALYENFYRAYNPKAADRLGVIYTPEEIVNFMIESTDYLLFKHFNKSLGKQDVEILDPATGTGTFITEIIEYLPSNQLESKYENEIHCNEVAILPYYIANLNIEYTYKQKMGKYKEFENICLVDTLDNLGFSKNYENQLDFFGVFDENAERIDKQNSKRISVIIGNPPYNANQLNENENNKNREYPDIDKRIKDTYIKQSTAQKTKLYDMYARFYRWASDRIDKNGIVAFITNRSFIDSRTFDGFRKVVEDEFSTIYIVDLGGDIRKNPKLSGPTHNVFAIQTGVAIAFFVKTPKDKNEKARIFYSRRPEMEKAIEKLSFLRETKFQEISFELISPDVRNNWLNKSINNWDDLLPVASKEYKLGNVITEQQPIFKLFSLGVVTARDEWVFDFNKNNLSAKVNFFIDLYNAEIFRWGATDKQVAVNDFVDRTIKWTSELESYLSKHVSVIFDPGKTVHSLYRPFVNMNFYYDKIIIHRTYQQPKIFPFGYSIEEINTVIAFSGGSSSKPFSVLATNHIYSYDLLEKTQCLPYYIFVDSGERVENIVDDAQRKFQNYYKDETITKRSIFTYVYAVLHNPIYRQRYEINLKNDFPHIPFYKDFWKWSEWGRTLMDLHIDFEKVAPYPLQREEIDPETNRKAIVPKLLARKESGKIEIDTLTTLTGVPNEVWDYRLGTYSAVEWVLERYKEKSPKDPTIREKFNTYKFAGYKEQVIDLIGRVCTVSVETMKIVKEMELTGEQ